MESEIARELLNRKIAYWLGFERIEDRWSQNEGKTFRWLDPDGRLLSLLPPLVTSLNAQLKYIFPKLQNKGYIITLTAHEQRGYSAEIISVNMSNDIFIIIDDKDNMAESFALALDKLIDSDKDK